MKVECIDKYYCNNKVVGYMLQDEAGNISRLTKEQTKQGILSKELDVLNLQVDSLGRVVDKKIIDDSSNMSEEQKWIYLFEYWYKHIPYDWIKFTVHNFDNRGAKTIYPPGYEDVFGNTPKYMQDGAKVAGRFEKYIKEKYNCLPFKLEVRSKNGLVYWINYVMCMDKPDGAQAALTLDWQNNYGKEKEYYLNPSNYGIRSSSLDPAKEGVYKVQIVKSEIMGVKDAFDSIFIGRAGARPNVGAEKSEAKDKEFMDKVVKQERNKSSIENNKYIPNGIKRILRRMARRNIGNLLSMFRK